MLALYRKYRPKSFAGLLGQDRTVEIFRNAGRTGKLAHAYVLHGPRGTGKTTAARLIAKLANCLSEDGIRQNGEPCNACVACAEIDAGRALDVIEIDAASNRGIDEIRNVRESIRSAPSSYRVKVFIIDEAHMLTGPAWNALLKTLEEPPERSMIILATTEYEKIPATIASRAQRFHFRKIPLREIVRKLAEIAKAEQIDIADDALELIASASDGGLRDAESLLDQVASAGGGRVDRAAVEATVGKPGAERVMLFADLVFAKDIPSILRQVAAMRDEGQNIADFNREFLMHLRRALLVRIDPSFADILKEDLATNELAGVVRHAALLDPVRSIALMKSLIRAYQDMRYSPFPHVPFEIAIIENLGQK